MNGFRDRRDAGRRLAAELGSLAAERPVVLALPRGGVPVGYEIARALRAPLDVWSVRKVGVPWHPELGVGAVAEGGYVHLNEDILEHVGLTKDELGRLIADKKREVEERVRRLRGDRPGPALDDRTAIIVDDGMATGGTASAAVRSIRAQGPRALVLAVPVAAPEAVRELARDVDQLVCLYVPADLRAVGAWYLDFAQVSDDEVAHLLDLARSEA